MNRLLPSPVLAVALFGLWLLLRQSLSVDTLLWGVVLAVGSVALTRSLRPGRVRVGAPLTVLRLVFTVLADTVASNVRVMKLILTEGNSKLRSGFVRVPLDVQDPHALAVLAVIICAIPGTTWAELSVDRKVLLIHVLVPHGEAEIVTLIKNRYERLLKEIFE